MDRIFSQGLNVSVPQERTKKGTLRAIGRACQKFREDYGWEQSDVAADTGYTKANISKFELGANDNVIIFLWYMHNGLSLQDVEEELMRNHVVN